MSARDVIKNQNLFLDGRGHAGQLQSFTPPKLTLQTEEFRGGGMDVPVDLTMGTEKLTFDFTLVGFSKDVLATWGVREGAFVPLSVREVLESFDGTVTPVAHTIRGKILEMDSGTHEPGKPAPLKVSGSAVYYKLTHGGSVVHEIDAENMVRTINGVDALAEYRAALGI